LARVKYWLTSLAVMDDQPADLIAQYLRIHPQTRLCACFVSMGSKARRKPTGRPAKLTATQKEELARLIEAGPQAAGFSAACWRSPLVPELILTRFGIGYSVL
jgi:hypothetical protein